MQRARERASAAVSTLIPNRALCHKCRRCAAHRVPPSLSLRAGLQLLPPQYWNGRGRHFCSSSFHSLGRIEENGCPPTANSRNLGQKSRTSLPASWRCRLISNVAAIDFSLPPPSLRDYMMTHKRRAHSFLPRRCTFLSLIPECFSDCAFPPPLQRLIKRRTDLRIELGRTRDGISITLFRVLVELIDFFGRDICNPNITFHIIKSEGALQRLAFHFPYSHSISLSS